MVRRQLDAHSGANVLLHDSYFINKSGRRIGRWTSPLGAASGLLARDFVWERLLVQNFVASGAPVFRLSAARRAGPLDEELWYTADWDFWLKLTSTDRTVTCPQPLLSVRIHGSSQTMTRAAGDGDLRCQYDAVLNRHLTPWINEHASRRSIAQRAKFSADLNVALASRAGGGRIPAGRLLVGLARLGPRGGWRYFRDSRITERVASRLRAGGGELTATSHQISEVDP